jgi:hypothetical protein
VKKRQLHVLHVGNTENLVSRMPSYAANHFDFMFDDGGAQEIEYKTDTLTIQSRYRLSRCRCGRATGNQGILQQWQRHWPCCGLRPSN